MYTCVSSISIYGSQTPSMFTLTNKNVCFLTFNYMVLFRPFELLVGHHSGESAPCCLPLPGRRQCLAWGALVSLGEHQICAAVPWCSRPPGTSKLFKGAKNLQGSAGFGPFEIKSAKNHKLTSARSPDKIESSAASSFCRSLRSSWNLARGQQHGFNYTSGRLWESEPPWTPWAPGLKLPTLSRIFWL